MLNSGASAQVHITHYTRTTITHRHQSYCQSGTVSHTCWHIATNFSQLSKQSFAATISGNYASLSAASTKHQLHSRNSRPPLSTAQSTVPAVDNIVWHYKWSIRSNGHYQNTQWSIRSSTQYRGPCTAYYISHRRSHSTRQWAYPSRCTATPTTILCNDINAHNQMRVKCLSYKH
jgi:hypothetical protein